MRNTFDCKEKNNGGRTPLTRVDIDFGMNITEKKKILYASGQIICKNYIKNRNTVRVTKVFKMIKLITISLHMRSEKIDHVDIISPWQIVFH